MDTLALFILLCVVRLNSDYNGLDTPAGLSPQENLALDNADDSESDTKKMGKRERNKYMKELFASMKEKDTGTSTNNIHVLAQRFISSGQPVNLDAINRFIRPYGYSLSLEQFNKLIAIKPITFELPLDDKSKGEVRALLGPLKKGNYHGFSVACYVFTRAHQEGKCTFAQYVGSSIVMANRLGFYMFPSVFKVDNRDIIKSLKEYGYDSHTLTLYVVDSGQFLDPNLDNASQRNTALSLSRGLEQYLIFTLNPSMNTNKVAGGKASDRIKDENLMKLYVYNEDGTVLLYVSTYRAILELGVISGTTLSDSMRTGKPSMGLLYSRTKVLSAAENIMSEEEFKNLLFVNKMTTPRKKSVKPNTGRPSRVRLTDTTDPSQPQQIFVSKSAATAFTQQYPDRIVHRNIFARAQEDTFTHKGWLVEVLD